MIQKEVVKNDAIIKSIAILLKAYKKLTVPLNHNNKEKRSLKYLLNQSIREYNIPLENRHVSKKANNLWKKITTKDIRTFHYRDKVVCENLKSPIHNVMFYNSAHKNGMPQTLSSNTNSFPFNNVFHEEHIVPVSLILNEMVKMDTFDDNSIKAQLDKMHLCVMLKKEDRAINSKMGKTANRTLNFDTNVNNIYGECDITLLPDKQFP